MNDDPNIAWAIFVHFGLLSLMAVGGGVLALAPDMMRFVADVNGWITAKTFVDCFTLAQIAPGPNFLFATLVGFEAAGLPGAVAGTAALVVPPAILTLVSLHLGGRINWGGWGRMVRAAILPLSIGLVASTAWSLGTSAIHTLPQLLLFAVFVGTQVWTKFSPLWLMAVGAVAGVAGWV